MKIQNYQYVLFVTLLISACSGSDSMEQKTQTRPASESLCSQEQLNLEEARVRNEWVKSCYKKEIPEDESSYFLLVDQTGAQRKAPLNVKADCQLAKEFKIESTCPVRDNSKGYDPSEHGLDAPGQESAREENLYVAKISKNIRRDAAHAGLLFISFSTPGNQPDLFEYRNEEFKEAKKLNALYKQSCPEHPVVRLVEEMNSVGLHAYYELNPFFTEAKLFPLGDCRGLEYSQIHAASLRKAVKPSDLRATLKFIDIDDPQNVQDSVAQFSLTEDNGMHRLTNDASNIIKLKLNARYKVQVAFGQPHVLTENLKMTPGSALLCGDQDGCYPILEKSIESTEVDEKQMFSFEFKNSKRLSSDCKIWTLVFSPRKKSQDSPQTPNFYLSLKGETI